MFAQNGTMEAKRKKSVPAKKTPQCASCIVEDQLRTLINQHAELNERLQWRVIKNLTEIQPYQSN